MKKVVICKTYEGEKIKHCEKLSNLRQQALKI